MQSESRSSKQLKLNKCIENSEAHNRLLTFFQMLNQINKRENLVKNENPNNKRNTDNTNKSK